MMTQEEAERIYDLVDAARTRGDFVEADRLRYSIPLDKSYLDFMLPLVGRDGVNKMYMDAESCRKEKLERLELKMQQA